jgi:putative DNA primase/helicase
MRRRLLLVECTNKPDEKNIDRELVTKLQAEWPGIAWWMVQGCLEWQRIGLSPPQTVRVSTAEYFERQDDKTHWFNEWVDPHKGGPDAATPQPWFGKSWKEWASSNGVSIGKLQDLYDWIEDEKHAKRVRIHGVDVFKGIQLRLNPRSAQAEAADEKPAANGGNNRQREMPF